MQQKKGFGYHQLSLLFAKENWQFPSCRPFEFKERKEQSVPKPFKQTNKANQKVNAYITNKIHTEAAAQSGVWFFPSAWSTLAPLLNRNSTTSKWPFWFKDSKFCGLCFYNRRERDREHTREGPKRGVLPQLSGRSTSAPCSIRNLATSKWPS